MTNRLLALVTLTLLLSGRTTSAQAAEPAPLRVGAAAVNLKADDSMRLAGMIGPTYAKGQEGELRAVATVIEQPGSGKVAIVGCDVLFVTREMVDRVAAQIEKSCGIPPANLLVNASHTHHAPATVLIHACQPEPEFIRTLEAGIVQAVEEANAHLADNCRFLFRLEEEPNIGQNSRILLADGMINWIGSSVPMVRPTGPFDPELPVLSFRDGSDKLVGVIYNHSTHTIGTLHGAVRSASFYGLAAQEMEKQLGAPIVFLEGASGSTHLLSGGVQQAIDHLKVDLAEGVAKAEPRKVNQVAAIRRPFRYKIRTFDEATEEKKVIDYLKAHAPSGVDGIGGVFREARRAVQPEQGQERESYVQAILIGDVALVGVSGEFFTGLGMEIKRRSPFPDTYVAELANDWIGYLPDRFAFELGGYQTWVGSHNFAEIGTGERVVDAGVAILEELAQKYPPKP
jgi:hypothetical protein